MTMTLQQLVPDAEELIATAQAIQASKRYSFSGWMRALNRQAAIDPALLPRIALVLTAVREVPDR